MKFRPERTMVKAYQRDRKACKEDNKTALTQETDGFQMTMSRLRSSHGAPLKPSTGNLAISSGEAQCRLALTRFTEII